MIVDITVLANLNCGIITSYMYHLFNIFECTTIILSSVTKENQSYVLFDIINTFL